MKKFFALALVVCLFAVSNMYANNPVSDDCDVNVIVLQTLTITGPADWTVTVVNDHNWAGSQALDWLIHGTANEDLNVTLTMVPGGTGYPVMTWTPTTDVTLDGSGNATQTATITGIATSGATAGTYGYKFTCTASYNI
jgi:hypothetical protein